MSEETTGQCALELYMGADAEAAVRQIWDDLDAAGIISLSSPQGWRPHVSLAVGDGVDAQRVRDAVSEVATSLRAPAIALSHVGLFVEPWTVLFLGVTPSADLLALQRTVHGPFAGATSSPWPYYETGAWTPHSPLAMHIEPDAVGRAVEIAGSAPLPISSRGTEIALVDLDSGERSALARLT